MEFGFSIPTGGPLATPGSLIALAKRGEELGFEIISVSDHIVMPMQIDSRYPYSETGKWPSSNWAHECLEQLTIATFLAGQTSKAMLLTSVMVLPYRNPVPTAKVLASIDVLSNGRLIVGCGVGWMREEFEAVEAPPYEERGAVSDEYIEAFKELWTSETPSFEGKYCRFSDISFLPKPVQKPHPPIWIGGESPPALRRAARLGDAWFPIGSNPQFPVGTAAQLAKYVSRLGRYAEDVGRSLSEIDVAYSVSGYNPREAEFLADGKHKPFTGTPHQIADDVKSFEELGVGYLLLGLRGDILDERLDAMERFADDVRPLT